MRKAISAFLTGLAVAAGASAAPIFDLKNEAIALANGWDGRSFEVKYTNYENFTDTDGNGIDQGDINYGIFKVTSITALGTTTSIWQDGDNGAELTGIFGNILVNQVIPVAGGFTINSTGGFLNMFINPFGSLINAGTGGYTAAPCAGAVGGTCYNTITNVAGGGSFIDTLWTPGVLDPDLTTTVNGTVNALTSPLTGTAQGYLNVTGGTYASMFDTNGFGFSDGSRADLFNQNSFCSLGAQGCDPIVSNWVFGSEDPVRGAFAVPEPGSLALVGIALLGAGTLRRRWNSDPK